ncbi:MAG: HYR domain-containing protein, partial [Sulfuricurvum sp.]|nr:HYR domain-containing protein [Sulfuricurvum sp.]
MTLTVTDPGGNSDTCTAIVTVLDNIAPTAICKNITVQLDGTGNASIVAADVDNGSTDACGIATRTLDKSTFTCTDKGANTITLTLTDIYGNVSTCTATVTVEDTVKPVITCVADQTVSTDNNLCTYTHSGTAWNTTATDGCATITSLTYALSGATTIVTVANTSLDGQIFNKGITTITWTAIDASGNTETCSNTITVNDVQLPNPVCKNVTINLDASGNASIVAADINNGSTDNCGIQSISVSTTAFTCANLGANTVTLTVTDSSGNIGTCDATVTVNDLINPVAACTPITIQLNALGTYTLTAGNITTMSSGSTDNCSIVTRAVSPNTFNCTNIAIPVNVTLTVTDAAGNTNTCNTTVTVEDNVAPTAICKNITVQLNSSGNATITAANIDNGSNDACGILSLVASKTAFTCADLGANTVTLTVTDNNGNVSTCNATVTIADTVKPTYTFCPVNKSVPADATVCTYTHSDNSWNATASDNCAVNTLAYTLYGATTGTGSTLNGVTFNNGLTTVTWTATDA